MAVRIVKVPPHCGHWRAVDISEAEGVFRQLGPVPASGPASKRSAWATVIIHSKRGASDGVAGSDKHRRKGSGPAQPFPGQ